MEDDSVVRLPRPGASVVADPLLEVLRSGARRMLQQVIEAEVEGFLAAHAELEDAQGRRRVVRNGHAPERGIQTGLGPIAVRSMVGHSVASVPQTVSPSQPSTLKARWLASSASAQRP